MNNKKIIFAGPLFLALIALQNIVLAAAPYQLPSAGQVKVTSLEDVQTNYVNLIFNWIFTGLIIFAVAEALLAAYKYVTDGGSGKEVAVANKMLWYAAAAVAVALLAKAIPAIVGSFFSTPITIN